MGEPGRRARHSRVVFPLPAKRHRLQAVDQGLFELAAPLLDLGSFFEGGRLCDVIALALVALDVPRAESFRLGQIGGHVQLIAGLRRPDQPVGQIFVRPHERTSVVGRLVQYGYLVAVAVAGNVWNLDLAEVRLERAVIIGLELPEQGLETRLISALLAIRAAVAPIVPQLRLTHLDLAREREDRDRTGARPLAVIGRAATDVERAEQALAARREGRHQLIGKHHGAEAAHVVHTAGGVDEDETIAPREIIEQRRHQQRRALVQAGPLKAAHSREIVAVEAPRLQQRERWDV